MKFSRTTKSDVPSRRLAGSEPRPSISEQSTQFRRNRTLSGVQKAQADEKASPRSHVHHLTRQRQKLSGILAIVISVTVLLAILITQLSARIIVTGSTKPLSVKIDPAAYETVINEYLAVNPAGRLRFALNERELSDFASTVAPEVSYIKQSGVENIVDTHFTITFRQPIAGWQINGKQFYVDDSGVVFDKNYYETPSVQIIDESGVSPEQGSTVASARFLSFVGRVVALSKSGGYEVTEAILPVGTTRQLEVRLKDVAPRVKLSIDRGAGEQVEDMTRALRYLTSKGVSAEYVDVRVGGRAIYR